MFTSGPTAESTKVNGKIIKWRDMAFSHGQMAEDMRANTSMIKRKERESSTGI